MDSNLKVGLPVKVKLFRYDREIVNATVWDTSRALYGLMHVIYDGKIMAAAYPPID